MRWMLLALTLTACVPTGVSVRGEHKPRLTLGYSDHRYYAVTHHAAYPEARGASSGLYSYAGRLEGFVCGTDVWFEADYRGSRVQLLGYVEPIDASGGSMRRPLPAQIEVRDSAGRRAMFGTIGLQIDTISSLKGVQVTDSKLADDWILGDTGSPLMPQANGIDIAFNTSGLSGTIASRHYDLRADGADNLVGTMTVEGEKHEFVLRGVSGLWSMPVADQAAILPIMLSCDFGSDAPEGVQTLAGRPILNVNFSPLAAR
jgi:hypothetical protein